MLVLTLIKIVIGWFVLMLLGTNLIGIVVRGFFTNPELEKLHEEAHHFIKNEIEKYNRTDKATTLVSGIILVAYLVFLGYFWNIGVVISALMLMLSRIPDLLMEIKTGKKNAWKNAPKDFTYVATTLMTYGSLVVLFFSIR